MYRPHPRFAILTAVAAVAALAVPAAAHHSTAMFNWGKELPMADATVERWDWTNPHTFLYVTVPAKSGGGTERWAFEGMSPNHLGRTGWTKRTLKPGDKIKLTYYSLKDGRKGGFNVSVTLPNGQVLRQLNSPTDNPARP
jgi:hypothetical protein